jgi:hypothetical protein
MTMMLSSAQSSEGDRAHGAGDRKVRVAAALAPLGINSDAELDDNRFCIDAATGLAQIVMERAGARPSSFDDMDAFIGGLFAFVFSDLLTQKLGGDFEIVAAVAARSVVPSLPGPERHGAFVNEIIAAFNNRGSTKTMAAIGESLNALLVCPTDDAIERLADLFKLGRKHAA